MSRAFGELEPDLLERHSAAEDGVGERGGVAGADDELGIEK